MVVRRIFAKGGEIVDFSKGWPKRFFCARVNSELNKFHQLKTNRKTFFYQQVDRETSNFKIQGEAFATPQ